MESILGLLGNVASGGVFGLIGSIIGAGAKYLQAKQQQAIRREEWNHELQLLDRQERAAAAETERELAVVAQSGSWQGLATSIRADAAVSNVHKWANDIRALFRPLLTVLLVGVVGWFFYMIVVEKADVMVLLFTEAELKDILRYLVENMVFAATTAVVWWFGDRAMAPPGAKNR